MTQLERDVALQLAAHGLEPFVTEHRWHPTRRWRFDVSWPQEKVALEIEGGVFSGGRHTNPKGFHDDCEKYNEATLAGWLVIRVTTKHIDEGEHLRWVRMALAERSDD